MIITGEERNTNRRAFYAPPLFVGQVGEKYNSEKDIYEYFLMFKDMFGSTTEICGFSKTVNHLGNFYKSAMAVVEEVEKRFFLLPRLNMLPDKIKRKGRGSVHGRSNTITHPVFE